MLTSPALSPASPTDVVLTTMAIYLVLLIVVRIAGTRSLATIAATDLAYVVAVGAVVGRITLLAVPTLETGVIALVVLFAMQFVLTLLRRSRALGSVLAPPAVRPGARRAGRRRGAAPLAGQRRRPAPASATGRAHPLRPGLAGRTRTQRQDQRAARRARRLAHRTSDAATDPGSRHTKWGTEMWKGICQRRPARSVPQPQTSTLISRLMTACRDDADNRMIAR